MTKHRDLEYNDRLPVAFVDPIQEFISTLISNLQITLASGTSIQVIAGTGNDQVCVGIGGLWRYNSATATAAHPGGASGEYDVYVVASANVFTPSGAPPGSNPETDTTDYTFGLVIIDQAHTPTGNYNGNPIVQYRKIAEVSWSGTAITAITPTAGSFAPGSASTSSRLMTIILG